MAIVYLVERERDQDKNVNVQPRTTKNVIRGNVIKKWLSCIVNIVAQSLYGTKFADTNIGPIIKTLKHNLMHFSLSIIMDTNVISRINKM